MSIQKHIRGKKLKFLTGLDCILDFKLWIHSAYLIPIEICWDFSGLNINWFVDCQNISSKTDNNVIQELVCANKSTNILILAKNFVILDNHKSFITLVTWLVFAIFSFWNPWTWNYKSVVTLVLRLLFSKNGIFY